MRRKEIKDLLVVCYALVVTSMIGKWVIYAAYLERGYAAAGGEYLLIPMVFLAAYKLFGFFIKALEKEVYGSEKKRSRGNAGARNHRSRV